ncbi:BTB/POZ domain-containing protein At4g08455 [Folsomia candida]|uniref:BTB/POZ domain-containing protein At4g08455 n=1 Tax=Folsomia candida TaxID=158441 RepID=UPI000B8F60FD|nr:BTB/POZ domain-containing protein At4g08455 [Folsomia candida]
MQRTKQMACKSTGGVPRNLVFPCVHNSGWNKANDARVGLSTDLSILLKSGTYADVTLRASDGETFPAHKAILSARSPFFWAMFESQVSDGVTRHVIIGDMSGPALGILLNFVYTAEFDSTGRKDGLVWQDVYAEVLSAAAKYKLPILKDQCDQHLVKVCNADNSLALLCLAKQHKLVHAEEEVKDWIADNLDDVLDADL